MNLQSINRASAAAVGFLAVSVVFAALSLGLKLLVVAPAIDAGRAIERTKALAEIRAEEEQSLTTVTMLDAKHNTVRLPIETAMKIVADGRADLNMRLEKATAPVKTESFE